MLNIFLPPVFSDGEKTSKALLFFKVIIGSIIIITLVEAIEIIILPEYFLRWIFIIISFNLFCFVFLFINKKNYSRLTLFYFVSLLLAALLGLAWTAGGIRAPIIYNLPVVILLAGLLLGRNEGIVTAVASTVGVLGLAFADYFNLLPSSLVTHNPLSIWISVSSSAALITLLQYHSVVNLKDSLNKANLELSLRNKIEENLRSSEAFRWRVFDSSRIPIVIMDVSSFRFIDCNQVAIDFYRFSSREETIGKTPLHVSPQTQYDGAPSSEKAKFYIDKALAEGSVVFEWKHQRPDGELWDAEVHLMSFQTDDRKLLQFSLIDITERKRAETELRISEERFRLILENMPILLNAFDEEGKVIVWNKACQETTGYSPREIIGNPKAMELLYPDFNYRKKVWDTSLDKTNKNNIYDLVTKNNETRTIEWFDIYHSLTIPGWDSWGIGQDITEREQAKKALLLSEEKFRNVFEHSMVGISMTTLDYELKTNDAYCKILGYSKEELTKLKWQDITSADCIETDKQIFDSILRGEKESERWEKKYIHKNGNIVWVDISVILQRDEKGKPLYFITVINDITERKLTEETLRKNEAKLIQSEQRLQYALNANSDALWEWNYKTGQAYYNARWFEILGYANQEFEMTIETWKNLCHPDDYADAQEKISAVINNPDSKGYNVEFRMKHKNGSWIWILGRGNVVVRDENQNAILLSGTNTDINDRKLAEIARVASESQFRELWESTVEGIVIHDQGKIIELNDALCKIFGLKREQAIGKSILNFAPKDFQETLREYLSSGNHVAVEAPSFRLDGTKIFIEFFAKGIVYHGKPARMVAIRDITERKKAEERIVKLNRIYSVISQINQTIVRTRDKNKLFEDVCKIAVEYGKFQMAWIGLVDEETKTLKPITFAGNESGYLSKIKTISILDIEEGRGPSGTSIRENRHVVSADISTDPKMILWREEILLRGYKSSIAIPIRFFGKVIGAVTLYANMPDFFNEEEIELLDEIVNDVSYAIEAIETEEHGKIAELALKTSEEKFRRAFIVSPDSININRLSDGKYVQINQGFTRIMGYEESDIIGKSSLELNIWKNVEDRQKLVEGLRKHGTVENLEAEFYAKDGAIKNGLMSATLIDLNNEKHILSITRDISERKQIELELDVYRKQLEDLVRLRTEAWEVANEELKIQLEKQREYELMLQQSLEKEKELSEIKSRFISTTSHEFRTPLTSVLSSAEMLQRFLNKWSEEKRNEHFERIKNSVVYLTKLLDDVLTISRTETGKLSYHPESLDLKDFADECTQDAKSLMTINHELKLNYNSKQRVYWFDRKLMKFIFNNLLSNAVKYSPEGGKVEITISSVEKFFLIEVVDEGIGIPSEEAGKIFDSFYRSKNAENISGTGLGLAIVKRAVDLHSGNIIVKSEIGKGATFIVRIPIEIKS